MSGMVSWQREVLPCGFISRPVQLGRLWCRQVGASPLAVSIAFPLLYVNILVTADFLQKVAWIFTSHAFAHAALPLSAIQPPAHSYTLLIQH